MNASFGVGIELNIIVSEFSKLSLQMDGVPDQEVKCRILEYKFNVSYSPRKTYLSGIVGTALNLLHW